MLISGKRRLPVVIKCVDFELGFGLLIAAALMAFSVSSMFGQGNRPQRGQAATVEAPISRTRKVPQWETAAGGKMSFDVASIRPSKPGTAVRCSCAGERKGRGRRACGIWACNL
jgi:hypothetical protein